MHSADLSSRGLRPSPCLTLLICALAGIEFTSFSLIAVGVNMTAWAILMAALFTLQQQRAILVDPAQSNLLLALNNSALYLGAAIGSAAFGAVISAMSFAFVSPLSAGVAALSCESASDLDPHPNRSNPLNGR
jgi:predicted MFS family arabinose efflux permease